MRFRCDNGAGGEATYLTLDGGLGYMVADKQLRFADGVNLYFGNSNDAQIKHDGSDFAIANDTGNMYLTQNTNDGDMIFECDDGSGGTTSYFHLDGGMQVVQYSKNLYLTDNIQIRIGSGSDLQIYHDGSHSYIDGTTTGDLYIRSTNDDVVIQGADDVFIYAQGGEDAIIARGNGAVELYYNNAKKIETAAAGVNTYYSETGNTDGTHAGDIVNFGETTTVAGKIYYYKSDGAWALVDADAVGTCKGMLGVALGTSSNTHGMLLRGMVTLDHDPGAVGDTLFASTTAGQATATAPSGSGDIVRVLGYCLNASNGQIWFNPDGAFVEVA
jgi:hypothetical protein